MADSRNRASNIALLMGEYTAAMQEAVEAKAGEPACMVVILNCAGATITVGNLDPIGSRDLLRSALETCERDCEAFEAARKRRSGGAPGKLERPH